MRKLGVRIKPLPVANSHPSIMSAEVYDVETGQTFGNIRGMELKYDVDGPIQATVTFLVNEIGEWLK